MDDDAKQPFVFELEPFVIARIDEMVTALDQAEPGAVHSRSDVIRLAVGNLIKTLAALDATSSARTEAAGDPAKEAAAHALLGNLLAAQYTKP